MSRAMQLKQSVVLGHSPASISGSENISSCTNSSNIVFFILPKPPHILRHALLGHGCRDRRFQALERAPDICPCMVFIIRVKQTVRYMQAMSFRITHRLLINKRNTAAVKYQRFVHYLCVADQNTATVNIAKKCPFSMWLIWVCIQTKTTSNRIIIQKA